MDELSHEVVENEFKSEDDLLENAILVDLLVRLKDVVGIVELLSDLRDQVFSPLDLHVLEDHTTVLELLLSHFSKLHWQLHGCSLSVEKSLG